MSEKSPSAQEAVNDVCEWIRSFKERVRNQTLAEVEKIIDDIEYSLYPDIKKEVIQIFKEIIKEIKNLKHEVGK